MLLCALIRNSAPLGQWAKHHTAHTSVLYRGSWRVWEEFKEGTGEPSSLLAGAAELERIVLPRLGSSASERIAGEASALPVMPGLALRAAECTAVPARRR